MEQIAQFHVAVKEAEKFELNDGNENDTSTIFKYQEALLKKLYGTRTDWVSAVSAAKEDWQKSIFSYSSAPERVDLQAKSIMGNLDKLSKTVSGSRAAYEFLCEFAHPNAGAFFAFLVRSEMKTGKGEVQWVRKDLAPTDPVAFVEESQQLLQHVFDILSEVVNCFKADLEQWSVQKKKILTLTQTLIRSTVKVHPELFDVYELCPCGSGKKLKFCCKN